jgi:hypothetical protein
VIAMLGSSIGVGIMAWTGVCVAGYFLIRRSLYNILDPVAVSGIFVPFAAALLAVLCNIGAVPWSKFELFCLVLLAYGLGGRLVVAFMTHSELRAELSRSLAAISRNEVDVLYLITLVVTMALGFLGLAAGAAGDARQGFDRIFRPLVVAQSGLSLFSLLLLLSPYLSRGGAMVRLTVLLAFSIPFSGKSVLVPFLFWYGLRLLLDGRRITLRGLVTVSGIVLAGALLMGAAAYGARGVLGGLVLLSRRVWLSGDTYIYAYQLHGLDAVRGSYPVSFLRYMLHPITALVGIRAYERPLGAMIMSVLTGRDVLTGPNPHLPVLLDYFFPNAYVVSFLVAFCIGMFAFGFRPLGIAVAKGRGRYLRFGALTAAVFCPIEGFLDTSQVLITLIGILFVTGITTLLELVTTREAVARDVIPLQPRLSD